MKHKTGLLQASANHVLLVMWLMLGMLTVVDESDASHAGDDDGKPLAC